MTKKRFIKLLMSQGIQRNEAQATATRCNSRNFSYEKAYKLLCARNTYKVSFNCITEKFSKACKTVSANIKNLAERFKELSNKLHECDWSEEVQSDE